MAAEEPARRGRANKAKVDRKPIYERLAPFAPWDQRNIPSLLDDAAAATRATAHAEAATALAEAAHQIAGRDGLAPGVVTTLEHLAEVARWHATVWADELGGSGSGSGGPLAAPARAAAERADDLEALAGLARVALPGLVADAVLLQAELGDDLSAGAARWLALVIEDLETQRAELELVVQAQLAPGDATRLAESCAEVAQTV